MEQRLELEVKDLTPKHETIEIHVTIKTDLNERLQTVMARRSLLPLDLRDMFDDDMLTAAENRLKALLK